MNESGSVNTKIYAALVKARAEFKPVIFDKVNPHFRNRFASIAAINDAVVDALSKYGLMTMQPWTHLENGDVILETVLIHESGESIRSSCLVKAGKTDQQFGASCTYMRRYQLSSLLNVVGEEDDDGEADQGRISPPLDIKPKNPHGPKITEDQCAILDTYLQEFKDAEKGLCEKFGLTSVYDLQQKDFAYVVSVFEKRKKAKETV